MDEFARTRIGVVDAVLALAGELGGEAALAEAKRAFGRGEGEAVASTAPRDP